MDENRILPPLVRGKLRGFLNFFIDEVRIFKNICNSTNSEVAVQVQWWGDPSPALIRPKEFFICQKKMKYLCQKTYYHCAKYELKTEFSLFQNYLKACEILELAVLEVFKNIFIGSAFLKNLVNIIGQSNDQIIFPIVDYLGEVIGEMKIHTDVIVKNLENNTDKCLGEKRNLVEEPDLACQKSNFFMEEQKLLQEKNRNKIQECSYSPQSIEWFRNGGDFDKNLKIINPGMEKVKPENKEFLHNSFTNRTINECLKNPLSSKSSENQVVTATNTFEHKFPQVEVHADFSKVLSFPLKKGTFKCGPSKGELSKFKHCNKRTKKSSTLGKSLTHRLSNIKLHHSSSKQKSGAAEKISKDKSEICKKAETAVVKNHQSHHEKKIAEAENNNNNSSSSSNNNHIQLSIPRVSPISLPSSVLSDKSISLSKNKSVKASLESNKKKVLDYLLGFDMDGEEESMALNDFKNMSPCENFVETVSELYTTRESFNQESVPASPETELNFHTEKNSKNENSKKTFKNYKFDFDDPIEKKYYETFFAKENSSHDFEIAKILNQPQKNGLLKQEDAAGRKISLMSGDTFREQEETIRVCENDEAFNIKNITSNEDVSSHFENSNNCHEKDLNEISRKNKCSKCRYHKKLNELDTIIESLKNFEKCILNREKKTDFLKFEGK